MDLLAGCLTRELFLDEEVRNVNLRTWPGGEPAGLRDTLRENRWRVVRQASDSKTREVGNDWPPHAETMVGGARLANVRDCVERVLADGISGDLVETGVWRGGVAIWMRALLAALGTEEDGHRRVWAFDSFEGLPEADAERYPMDVPMKFNTYKQLSVGLDEVKTNFSRYGLLDERLRLVPGWFKDTTPAAAKEIESIAVLRLDGDMYESTIDVLTNLEPLVSPGGFVLVDDYGGIEACRQAVTDYRQKRGIEAEIHKVDWTGVWWRKPKTAFEGT